MNEQRQNELRQLRTPEEETDDMENENSNEVWPIFARGGDYGPRYDVMEEQPIESEDSEVLEPSDTYVEALTKKDLESLLHQPDPSLTVQDLPRNPQITFRKGSHVGQNDQQNDQKEERNSKKGQDEIVLKSRSISQQL